MQGRIKGLLQEWSLWPAVFCLLSPPVAPPYGDLPSCLPDCLIGKATPQTSLVIALVIPIYVLQLCSLVT